MVGCLPDKHTEQRMRTVLELTLTGRSAQQIAWDIGATVRTVVRYRARLRAAGLLKP